MDLLIVIIVFGAVLFGLLAIFLRRGHASDRHQVVVRRMTRPVTDIDITRRGRPREDGNLLAALWKLDLLRHLEEMMWQAGIYIRVSEMTLIIVLMFGAGLFFGQALRHDMPFPFVTG